MTLGQRMRSLRKMSFTSADKAANLLGITKPTLYSYEKDVREPQARTIIGMCELYGCSADYLLTGKEWGGDEDP